jgi:hypothetical protein
MIDIFTATPENAIINADWLQVEETKSFNYSKFIINFNTKEIRALLCKTGVFSLLILLIYNQN